MATTASARRRAAEQAKPEISTKLGQMLDKERFSDSMPTHSPEPLLSGPATSTNPRSEWIPKVSVLGTVEPPPPPKGYSRKKRMVANPRPAAQSPKKRNSTNAPTQATNPRTSPLNESSRSRPMALQVMDTPSTSRRASTLLPLPRGGRPSLSVPDGERFLGWAGDEERLVETLGVNFKSNTTLSSRRATIHFSINSLRLGEKFISTDSAEGVGSGSSLASGNGHQRGQRRSSEAVDTSAEELEEGSDIFVDIEEDYEDQDDFDAENEMTFEEQIAYARARQPASRRTSGAPKDIDFQDVLVGQHVKALKDKEERQRRESKVFRRQKAAAERREKLMRERALSVTRPRRESVQVSTQETKKEEEEKKQEEEIESKFHSFGEVEDVTRKYRRYIEQKAKIIASKALFNIRTDTMERILTQGLGEGDESGLTISEQELAGDYFKAKAALQESERKAAAITAETQPESKTTQEGERVQDVSTVTAANPESNDSTKTEIVSESSKQPVIVETKSDAGQVNQNDHSVAKTAYVRPDTSKLQRLAEDIAEELERKTTDELRTALPDLESENMHVQMMVQSMKAIVDNRKRKQRINIEYPQKRGKGSVKGQPSPILSNIRAASENAKNQLEEIISPTQSTKHLPRMTHWKNQIFDEPLKPFETPIVEIKASNDEVTSENEEESVSEEHPISVPKRYEKTNLPPHKKRRAVVEVGGTRSSVSLREEPPSDDEAGLDFEDFLLKMRMYIVRRQETTEFRPISRQDVTTAPGRRMSVGIFKASEPERIAESKEGTFYVEGETVGPRSVSPQRVPHETILEEEEEGDPSEQSEDHQESHDLFVHFSKLPVQKQLDRLATIDDEAESEVETSFAVDISNTSSPIISLSKVNILSNSTDKEEGMDTSYIIKSNKHVVQNDDLLPASESEENPMILNPSDILLHSDIQNAKGAHSNARVGFIKPQNGLHAKSRSAASSTRSEGAASRRTSFLKPKIKRRRSKVVQMRSAASGSLLVSASSLTNSSQPDPPSGNEPTLTSTAMEEPGLTVSYTTKINTADLILQAAIQQRLNSLYSIIHDVTIRHKIFNPEDIAKYPTFTDNPETHTKSNGELQEEIDKIDRIVSLSPVPVPTYLRKRAFLYGCLNRYKDAMTDIILAIHHDAFNTDAYWYRHQLHLIDNNVELALKDLDKITEYNKSHFGAYWVKAQLYQRASNNKLAIVNYSQTIKLKPDVSDLYLQRALLFETEKMTSYANEDFKTVRVLDPENIPASWNEAQICFNKGSWDDSIMVFNRLIRILEIENDDNCNRASLAEAHSYRGRANAHLGRWEEALNDLNAAIVSSPNKPEYFLYRGCLVKERNATRSLRDFSVSLLLDNSVNNIMAYFNRALLYSNLHKWHLAVADYLSVIELDPTMSEAYINLGIIYMKHTKDLQKALDAFNKAATYDPSQIKIYLCRGDLQQLLYKEYSRRTQNQAADNPKRREKSQSFNDRAIKDYTRALHMNPAHYLIYLYRGRVLLSQNRMKEATGDFNAAFELNNSIVQTFMQRALVLSFQRKHQQIVQEFEERRSKQDVTDSTLWMLVAKAKMKIGDYSGAIDCLAHAVERRSRDPQIYLQRGMCYERLGQWAEAANEYAKCVQLQPQFSKAHFRRGLCKLKLGNAKGVADINRAIKCEPNLFEAYLCRGSHNYANANYEQALDDANIALKLEPSSIRAYLLRGACRYRMRQYGAAIVDFTKASQLDGNCHYAFFNRAVAFQRLGHIHNAIMDYSIVLLKHDDSSAFRNRGLLYWKLGDHGNALMDLQAARDTFPADANLHILLALCLQKLGNASEALKIFTEASNRDKKAIEPYLGRGNVFASMGNMEAAKRDYARVIHMYPSCSEAQVNLGYALQLEGKHKQAWKAFSLAIAVDPDCTAALEGRAVVNYKMKNYFAAHVDISRVLEHDPNNAEYLTNKGVISHALGNEMETIQCYKLAIEKDPNYILAHFNLAYMYFKQKLWERAKDAYDRVIQCQPKDIDALINRSITKQQLGDTEGGLEDLNQALKYDPSNSVIYFNRANLLQSMERYEDAEQDFTRVIELVPNDRVARLKRGQVLGSLNKTQDAMQDYAKYFLESLNE